MRKENRIQQGTRARANVAKTKHVKTKLVLPIDYWYQIESMQKEGPLKGWAVDRIIRQFVIERLDQEYIDKEHHALEQPNHVEDIIPDKDK